MQSQDEPYEQQIRRKDKDMNKLNTYMLVGTLAITALTTTGCLLFVAGAGAGVGTVAYYDNELCAPRDVSVDRAWNAAHAVMKEMEYTIIPAETHMDATGGVVQGRNAKDQVVRIKLIRQTDKTTEIRVRVGMFATEVDKNAENLIFEKLSKRF